MPRLRLRPAARRDLAGIWHFSINRWGRRKAQLYMAQIRTQFGKIADGSGVERASDIREEYFIRRAGRHLIFYRKQPDAIDVVRILHAAMDPDRHFDDDT